MMHPALWKLYRLRWRGGMRRVLRGFKTWRGMLVTSAGVAMLLLWLGPPLLQAALAPRLFDPAWAQTGLPLILFASWFMQFLAAAGEQAIPFTVAEVDFLFAGPFRRRELLLYKLLGMALGSLVLALVLATGCIQWVTLWIAAFAGVWLVVVFFQLLNMTLALLVQWLGQVAYSRTRRVIFFVVGALAIYGAARALSAGGQSAGELAEAFRGSWAGWALLAPFEVFSRVITATSLGTEFALWTSLAFFIDVVLCAIVVGLDANYLEAAAAASQKRYDALQRWRSGGAWRPRAGRWRIPRLPFWAGAGPVAWRQSLQLLRSRALLASVVLLLVLAAFAWWLSISGSAPSQEGAGEARLAPLLMMLFMMNFIVVATMPFGFRADLDRMDWLKMLPLRSTSIVVGQALPLVAWLSVLDLVVLGGLGAVGPFRQIAWTCAVLVVPGVSLFVALEGFLFLMFPGRDLAVQPGDFQAYGRYMLLFALRMVVVGCCAAPAGMAGLAAFLLTESWYVSLLAAGGVVLCEAGLFVLAAAWAFRRFDVSLDTPAA